MDPEIIFGTVGGGGVVAFIAYKLFNAFFDDWKNKGKTISNHITHTNETLTSLLETNRQLIRGQEKIEECIQGCTQASIKQTLTNERTNKVLEDLTDVVKEKL